MKTSSHQFSQAAARAVVTVALAATIALAPSLALAARTSAEERAEARIAHMHSKLDITNSQEEQWAKVAEVMRDNARSMDTLMQTRHENAKSMTAVDDLISYGEITDAHADGIKKLTPVFATLYADMSDTQKAEADTLFRKGDHKRGKRR